MEISFVNSETIFRIKSKTFHCDHPNVEIDMDFRSVKCAKCGCNIDPFDFVLSLAHNENTYENRINFLKSEITRLENLKSKLKK